MSDRISRSIDIARKAFYPVFFLVLTIPLYAQSKPRTDWLFKATDDAKPKTLTVRRLTDGGDFISAKQFCFSLGCKLVYQWSASRLIISHRTEKRSAILNRFLRHVLINGSVFKLGNPILGDAKDGYLLPMSLAVVLTRELKLGKIWSEVERQPITETPRAGIREEELKRIVIDPGHGGADLGTSSGGILEKDVALIYAVRLQEYLRREIPDLEVSLTRSGDEYVSLADRAKLANSKNAQLFLSLHLNHAADSKVEGVETYILSPDATDDDARKVALLENETWLKSTQLTGDKAGKTDLLKSILVDMEQTKFIQSSAMIAALINQELKSLEKTRGLKSRGVKQAMFYVLSQVAMPSVLLEIGFLSSAGDRGRLMDVAFRDEFARSVVSAIKRFDERKY
ncbi:MAG TPA: N-acetylmuramoyl-L-alanine amidase [Oligoflexia bacterium]|nr:N-acetylmuramoyl-L-alanine amidase [Oligoflexia bacterium]